MQRYQIVSTGNIILADQAFVEDVHPFDFIFIEDDPAIAKRAAIVAELDAIQTLSTRTLFETLGGDKTQWAKIKTKADALREELKKL